jgi:adenylate cyclase
MAAFNLSHERCEVIVEGDDLYGEGINVAARLEQLAPPGGICVSSKVVREVEKKVGFAFRSLGEQRVKNIAEPVHIYTVDVQGLPSKDVLRAASRVHSLPFRI